MFDIFDKVNIWVTRKLDFDLGQQSLLLGYNFLVHATPGGGGLPYVLEAVEKLCRGQITSSMRR